jgi:hypothetical protein
VFDQDTRRKTIIFSKKKVNPSDKPAFGACFENFAAVSPALSPDISSGAPMALASQRAEAAKVGSPPDATVPP